MEQADIEPIMDYPNIRTGNRPTFTVRQYQAFLTFIRQNRALLTFIRQNRALLTFIRQNRALLFVAALCLTINIFSIKSVRNELRETSSQLTENISSADQKILEILADKSSEEKLNERILKFLKENSAALLLNVSLETEKIWKNISDEAKRIDTLEAPNKCRWVESFGRNIPPGAMVAGKDKGDLDLYVARVRHEGTLIPGKFAPWQAKTLITWAGKEIDSYKFAVLCNCTSRWLPINGTEIPANAFIAGETMNGEPLYVGRAKHLSRFTPGKVMKSNAENDIPVCYISYNGKVIPKTNFEILVL